MTVYSGTKANPALERAKKMLGVVFNNRWRLIDVAGTGGMATVFRAVDETGGDDVAVKLMHPQQAKQKDLRQRFSLEGKLMAQLIHKGSVRVFDGGTSESGEPFIVMELLEGLPVDQLWNEHDKKLPFEMTLDIAQQSLDFLELCHQHNVFHRDLKPGNIFVLKTGQVKVLDFGVAKVEDSSLDETIAGTAMGTPAYMSPEQAVGRRDLLDRRSDVFSMGATMYALMSGKHLHDASTAQQLYVLAATTQPPSLARVAPDMPLSIIRLVDKAVQWDPARRYQTADEMRRAINDILGSLKRGEMQTAAKLTEADEARAKAFSLSEVVDEEEEEDFDGVLDEDALEGKIGQIRGMFRCVELALNAIRQYGWDHRETRERVKVLSESIYGVLEHHPDGIQWSILPDTFEYKKQIVWEPEGLEEQIPFHLFTAGFRAFRILPGVDEDELIELLKWLRLNPTHDLPPEDDLATVFWTLGFKHIEHRLITSISLKGVGSSNDAGLGGLDESMEKRLIRARELARMLVTMGREAVLEAHSLRADSTEKQRSSADLADASVLETLQRELEKQESTWPQRLGRVLAAAYEDSLKTEESELIKAPLTDLATRYIRSGRVGELSWIYVHAMASLKQQSDRQVFATCLFNKGNLELLFDMVTSKDPLVQSTAEALGNIEGLDLVVDHLPGDYVDLFIRYILASPSEEVLKRLMAYVERFVAGNETELGVVFEKGDETTSTAVLELLTAQRTKNAAEALRLANKSKHLSIRLAALEARAKITPLAIIEELKPLLAAESAKLRVWAVRLIGEHDIRSAAPLFVLRCTDREFHDLPEQEKKLLLQILWEFAPNDAESVTIGLARLTSLMDKSQKETRRLAVEILGERATSDEALAVIKRAHRRRLWTSREFRQSSRIALDALTERLNRKIDD